MVVVHKIYIYEEERDRKSGERERKREYVCVCVCVLHMRECTCGRRIESKVEEDVEERRGR